MIIAKYSVEIKENRHPKLVRESGYEFIGDRLSNPEQIVKMLNECFRLGFQSEEHLVMIALDVALQPLGIFEVGHGTSSYCMMSIPDIFKRALMCGSNRIILAHNHPSGNLEPSMEDKLSYERLKDAGKILGIKVEDFLIISGNELNSIRRDSNFIEDQF